MGKTFHSAETARGAAGDLSHFISVFISRIFSARGGRSVGHNYLFDREDACEDAFGPATVRPPIASSDLGRADEAQSADGCIPQLSQIAR